MSDDVPDIPLIPPVWPPGGVPPFTIGSDVWPGVVKLIEESGELQQVLGKLMAYPSSPHPDGTDIPDRLEAELADVLGAILFAVKVNQLNSTRIWNRAYAKRDRFWRWQREAPQTPSAVTQSEADNFEAAVEAMARAERDHNHENWEALKATGRMTWTGEPPHKTWDELTPEVQERFKKSHRVTLKAALPHLNYN